MVPYARAVALAVALALAVAGGLALVTGRVLFPWLRRSVRRPGLWGAGNVLLAGAMTGAVAGTPALWPCAALAVAGLVLIGAAQLLPAPAR